jgi:UTP--glucose-1-phosphate uridylyltransferase
MIDTYMAHGGSVLACKRVIEDEEYDRYGIAGGNELDAATMQVTRIVEKPGKAETPSNMASVSGYLLTPEIFGYIDRAIAEHQSGELMVQPIMQAMIEDGLPFFARMIQDGTYYDTGDKLEYIKTVVSFALDNPEMGTTLRSFLREKLQ